MPPPQAMTTTTATIATRTSRVTAAVYRSRTQSIARPTRPMTPRRSPVWRRNMPHRAGESVSAFTAEISIATEIVTANCLNSVPEMPGMKPIGTNTLSSTKVMAIMGAVIWRIAFLVASCGLRSGSSSSTRSTFSTTTIASSTTMPMASTSASSDTVLAEYPSASSTAKVPTRLTGTAMVGMRVARKLPRNRNTTTTTRANASINVRFTSSIVSLTKVELL